MKNVLNTTLYLFVFAAAGILFQISCSNEDSKNNTVVNAVPLGKIIYVKTLSVTNQQLWIANYDGSNPTQIMVNFPPNVRFNQVTNGIQPRISPDGQTIFFVGVNSTGAAIYSCDSNGNNVQAVVPLSPSQGIELGQAY